jgi:hypothetical protein
MGHGRSNRLASRAVAVDQIVVFGGLTVIVANSGAPGAAAIEAGLIGGSAGLLGMAASTPKLIRGKRMLFEKGGVISDRDGRL